jgi:PPM family protein phosphatase
VLRITDQAFKTDVGRQRNANEDSYFARSPVFVVADGMGGAQAGEVASQTATEVFDDGLGAGAPEAALERVVQEANQRIHRLAESDPSTAGMGTTLTAAVLKPEEQEVAIAHVGDSRAYRLRSGKLEQLTTDHSLVEELRRKGQLTDEQASDHPQRSIITRALGPEEVVEVDKRTVPARPGDVFLLCSDGLTTMVAEERIARILAGATSLDAGVRALVDEANRAGGRDNITAIAFRVDDAAAPVSEPESPTLVGPAAAEEGIDAAEMRRAAKASERARRPRRRARTALKVLAGLLIVAALGFGAWYGNRHVWFLGTDSGGRVALYRGLPYDLPFGIHLYSERYASPIQTAGLPPQRRDSVTGHKLRSRSDAVSLIEDIQKSQGVP